MLNDTVSVRAVVIGAGIAGLLAAVMYQQRTYRPTSHRVAESAPSLKIIVVGAGIAGLCAAVALRQAGHEVEVFEKSAFAAEVGAALALTPNGAKVLSSLGFSFTRARAVRLTFWNVLHGETLQLLNGVDMTAAKARFGAEPWAVHRVDLHNELLRLATSTEEAGIPVKLHLSSEVIEATTSGKIILRDGSTRTADLVIGADGVKSAIRKTVTQEPPPTETTGSSAFRFLVDTQQLKDDKTLAALVERLHGTANLLADVKETVKERHMMAYTCRDGEVLNIVGVHPTRSDQSDDPETVKQVMLEEFGHFSPEILAIIRQASAIKCWPLIAGEPLPRWSKGRVLIIGDSAHAMLPFSGQGANSAIEDGGSLGRIFQDVHDAADIPARLELFHQARHARASRVQILSSVRAGKEKEVEAKLRQYSEGGIVPSNMMERTGHDFGFDALKKCDEVMGR